MTSVIVKAEGDKLTALLAFLADQDIQFKEESVETKLDRRLTAARMEQKRGELKEVDPHNIWESIS